MLKYKITYNGKGQSPTIYTDLQGKALLNTPQLNKGTAFSWEERRNLKLLGKLPSHVENLEQQTQRAYLQLKNHKTRLDKYIYLNNLHDKNEVLFYHLVSNYLSELLPIIYTPTVSSAVKIFSQKFRRPRGLYISYQDRDYIEEILDNRTNPNIDLIVVTDGECILGIGDQGAGGMEISVAKLAVYTILAGINPNRTLPIVLDVGTNNPDLLENPMYVGLHNKRPTRKAYHDFIDTFVTAVDKKFPGCLLHWEDLNPVNAGEILDKYQQKICTFNDDIQGTGIVATAAILAALKAQNLSLTKQNIVILGGGNAGLGIANRLVKQLQSQGLSSQQAMKRIWVIDRAGLLTNQSENIRQQQQPYVRDYQEIGCWGGVDLLTVIENVRPRVLIGCSGCGGAFSEQVIKAMASCNDQPIIMPLSNPNAKAEAHPQDILNWTKGTALIATGSPFPTCQYGEETIPISQCNNALVFPVLGLVVLAVKPKHISDGMLQVAAGFLSSLAPILSENHDALLLPRITDTTSFAKELAATIAKQAMAEGLCPEISDDNINQRLDEVSWMPKYYSMEYHGDLDQHRWDNKVT